MEGHQGLRGLAFAEDREDLPAAATTTKYAFGDTITQQQAQFAAKQTVEVGKFPPNAWGLYDMHGNVWEWCEDNWRANAVRATRASSRSLGLDDGPRVLRGGSWANADPEKLRSANRFEVINSSR